MNKPHRSRRKRWLLGCVIALVALLGLAWLAAPRLLAREMRQELASLPDGYGGDIEGAHLRLLDGEVVFEGLRVEKKEPPMPVPFLRAEEVVVGLERSGFRMRNTLRIVTPVVNLIDGKTPAQDQYGPHVEPELLREKLPFELSTMRIEDGQVHFRELEGKPTVDSYLSDLKVDWHDLANCLPPGTKACHSQLRMRARVMGDAPLTMAGRFERTPEGVLSLTGSLRNLAIKRLNPLLLRYAKVDVEQGRVNLDIDFRSQGDHYSALVVPKLHDVKVRGEDSKESKLGREMALGLAAGWLERRDGEKAVRVQGTNGGGPPSFKLIDRTK